MVTVFFFHFVLMCVCRCCLFSFMWTSANNKVSRVGMRRFPRASIILLYSSIKIGKHFVEFEKFECLFIPFFFLSIHTRLLFDILGYLFHIFFPLYNIESILFQSGVCLFVFWLAKEKSQQWESTQISQKEE